MMQNEKIEGAMKGPLFIVGVPRSGTTVFSNYMSRLPDVHIAPETHFMPEIWQPLRHLSPNSAADLEKILARLANNRWFSELELDTEMLRENFLSVEQQTWPQLFDTILKLHARAKGKNIYGEKTPGHYQHVETLMQWFPQARFIFVVRDPRGVAASNIRAPFAPSYAWFAARRWREMWKTYTSLQQDSRIHMVRYEDFVDDPEDVLFQTAGWLGIGAAAERQVKKMFHDGETSGSSPAGGWRAHHLSQASGQVTNGSVARWRRELSPCDVWIIQRIVKNGMRQAGYSLEPAPAMRCLMQYILHYPVERLHLAIHAAFIRLQDNARDAGIKQRMLLLTGKIWDALACLGNDWRRQPRNLMLVVGRQFGQSSSFGRIKEEEESVGLFLLALRGRGIAISLHASDCPTHRAARRIVRAFGLQHHVPVVLEKPSRESLSVPGKNILLLTGEEEGKRAEFVTNANITLHEDTDVWEWLKRHVLQHP